MYRGASGGRVIYSDNISDKAVLLSNQNKDWIAEPSNWVDFCEK